MNKLRVSGEGVFRGLHKGWWEQIQAINVTIYHRYVQPSLNRKCWQPESRIQLDQCCLIQIHVIRYICKWGFPGSSAGKESACNAGDPEFDSWVWKICWGRDRLPIPVFLGFPGGSDSKESICNEGDLGLIPGLGRSPGGGHDTPVQYSLLEDTPWTEEPGGQQSLGLQRVRHDWATKHIHVNISIPSASWLPVAGYCCIVEHRLRCWQMGQAGEGGL